MGYAIFRVLLRGPTISEDIKPNEQKTELCQLPPYPKRGGYVVINETSAAPGDVLDRVSLVRFTTDRDKKVFEIKRFTCSFGQWHQDIIEYESDALHFYTSWCPHFCSSFLSDQWTECTTPNSDENLRGARQCGSNLPKHQLEQNDIDLEEFCRLPPYPNKGTYVVQGRPEARPGDLLQNVSLIQYTGDARDEVITIKHLRCSSGAWYQKVFREAAESLHFHTSWCPNLCSECFGQKIAERPHYPLINNKVSKKKDNSQTTAVSCALPQPPKFGNYSVIGKSEATQPGEYGFLNLNYKCNTGYTLIGNRNVCCMKGAWSVALPKCTKFCHLIRQTGVVYACEEAGAGAGVESCGVYLPEGSVVTPRCNTPYYESRSPLKPMTCEDGKWSNLPECKAVCGLRMQGEESPAADARVKAPWNVAVYSKFPEFYLFHCGGSIVARNLVISTAACFMNFKSELLPTVNFLVMAGKLFYDKNKGNDDKAQESEVQNIKVSPRYTGSTNSHQHDIALVFLATPFTYDVQHVWPVCLNFDKDLDKTQLSEGRSAGLLAGGGGTESDFKRQKLCCAGDGMNYICASI
ncbi:Modular serine protease [Eumeta japonica]|uniref:Modular serine protease n=1 Tax=Eumeta variegata TaxID=151549 RepID=A0A4C1V4F3_EUMVA|nr:Modular serine protease [Eumeta japonica]